MEPNDPIHPSGCLNDMSQAFEHDYIVWEIYNKACGLVGASMPQEVGFESLNSYHF